MDVHATATNPILSTRKGPTMRPDSVYRSRTGYVGSRDFSGVTRMQKRNHIDLAVTIGIKVMKRETHPSFEYFKGLVQSLEVSEGAVSADTIGVRRETALVSVTVTVLTGLYWCQM